MSDQTVEAGWQQAPWRHGGNASVGPEIFLYAALNSTTQCYNTGCGFIAAAGNVLQLGQIQTSVSQLGLPGVEWGIAVLLDPYSSDWDVYHYDIATGYFAYAGYYPHAIWGTGPLSGAADRLDFGGEAFTGGTTAPLAYPRPPMGSTLNPLFATIPSPPENYLAYHHNIAYYDTSYVLKDWVPTWIPTGSTPTTAMTGYPVGCVYGSIFFSASAPVITGWGAILSFGGDGIGGGPGC